MSLTLTARLYPRRNNALRPDHPPPQPLPWPLNLGQALRHLDLTILPGNVPNDDVLIDHDGEDMAMWLSGLPRTLETVRIALPGNALQSAGFRFLFL